MQADGTSGAIIKGRGGPDGQIIANLLPLLFSELKKGIFSQHSLLIHLEERSIGLNGPLACPLHIAW